MTSSMTMLTRTGVLLALTLITVKAPAEDLPRDPTTVISELANRIYSIGETSANAGEMVDAEAKAADDIRRYVASGQTVGLLAPKADKQSPLFTAAYMGYPNVVAALLLSSEVKAHINDADARGITPWMAASFSMHQSVWTCNPSVLDNPYGFIPLLVTQPFYLHNTQSPYQKSRELLEEAGASHDLASAKAVWLNLCRNASNEAKAEVQASKDLQGTLQKMGFSDFTAQLKKMQKTVAEGQK